MGDRDPTPGAPYSCCPNQGKDLCPGLIQGVQDSRRSGDRISDRRRVSAQTPRSENWHRVGEQGALGKSRRGLGCGALHVGMRWGSGR